MKKKKKIIIPIIVLIIIIIAGITVNHVANNYYKEAKNNLENSEYDSAYDKFTKLGKFNYKDSKELAKETDYERKIASIIVVSSGESFELNRAWYYPKNGKIYIERVFYVDSYNLYQELKNGSFCTLNKYTPKKNGKYKSSGTYLDRTCFKDENYAYNQIDGDTFVGITSVKEFVPKKAFELSDESIKRINIHESAVAGIKRIYEDDTN